MAMHATEADLASWGPAAQALLDTLHAEERPAPKRATAAQTVELHSRRAAPIADGPALARRLQAAVQGVASARDQEAQTAAILALIREVGAVGRVLARG